MKLPQALNVLQTALACAIENNTPVAISQEVAFVMVRYHHRPRTKRGNARRLTLNAQVVRGQTENKK